MIGNQLLPTHTPADVQTLPDALYLLTSGKDVMVHCAEERTQLWWHTTEQLQQLGIILVDDRFVVQSAGTSLVPVCVSLLRSSCHSTRAAMRRISSAGANGTSSEEHGSELHPFLLGQDSQQRWNFVLNVPSAPAEEIQQQLSSRSAEPSPACVMLAHH